MQPIPYDKQLVALMDALGEGDAPTLLLHVCCAPCASSVLERLCHKFRVTLFYYNPNIESQEEYEKREGEVRRLVEIVNTYATYPVTLLETAFGWDHETFLAMAKGLEDAPEGGSRCLLCYALRLRKTACLAAQLGFAYFTTTLTLSPLKNAQKINEIGEKLGAEYGVKHLPSDFKKRDGYKRSVELSKEYGLYRQDYCGCSYSKRKS